MMYTIDHSTREALSMWMDLARPGMDDLGKLEQMRRVYAGLKLHELPNSLALFIFDTGLRDIRLALKMKEFCDKHRHWFELFLMRLEAIGPGGLLEILKYCRPYEEGEHHHEYKRNGQSR